MDASKITGAMKMKNIFVAKPLVSINTDDQETDAQ